MINAGLVIFSLLTENGYFKLVNPVDEEEARKSFYISYFKSVPEISAFTILRDFMRSKEK